MVEDGLKNPGNVSLKQYLVYYNVLLLLQNSNKTLVYDIFKDMSQTDIRQFEI